MLAYQGSAYCGWQMQPQALSVQAVLEQAFEQMTGFAVRVRAAGRTDAGVHAEGQVVCLDNPSRHEPHTLLKGLNAHLPKDVVIRSAEVVGDDFDPRRLGLGKHYRYTIHTGLVRPLFDRKLCWHIRAGLDPEAMNEALGCLVGEHDFSSFRASDCEASSPVRTINLARWVCSGDKLVLHLFGRSFLKHMVRNVVGTCIEVGRGRFPAQKVAQILDARDRRQAGPTAPALGLCLCRVFFEEEEYREQMKEWS